MRVLTSLIFMFVVRFGSGADFGHEHPNKEYATVFKNIPIIFERLIQTLEENPEVLERDDTSVFNKRQAQYKDETVESNTGTDEKGDNENERRAFDDILGESKEYADDKGLSDDADSDEAIYTDEDNFYDNFYENDPNDVNEKLTPPIDYKIFKLSSDEIAEQAIIIEQMLEKQNSEERLI